MQGGMGMGGRLKQERNKCIFMADSHCFMADSHCCMAEIKDIKKKKRLDPRIQPARKWDFSPKTSGN